MKRNFEDQAIRMAKFARMEEQRIADPRCLVCRYWREASAAAPASAANASSARSRDGPITDSTRFTGPTVTFP